MQRLVAREIGKFRDNVFSSFATGQIGSRATMHVIEKADHSFHVLKSTGRSNADVLRELADTAASWAEGMEET
jgi:hypothetical protein